MPGLSILPVTTLACIEHDQTQYLLVGRGRTLEVHDLQQCKVISSIVALSTYAIHGVVITGSESFANRHLCKLLVYGGRHVACVSLDLKVASSSTISCLLTLVKQIELSGWVLCARKTLNPYLSACFVTSDNALIEVIIDENTSQISSNTLNEAIFTFLYSADCVQLDDSSFIIASGTAFGEIWTWACKYNSQDCLWKAYPWKKFHGHNGSIFGVSISSILTVDCAKHRVLATCSDDRTIRLWDISGLDDFASKAGNAVKTTFAPENQNLVMTWAHLSRIWNIDFASGEGVSSSQPTQILSTAEDAQAQLWLLDVHDLFGSTNSSNILKTHKIDRYHAGKNIWARCHRSCDQRTTLYTGGADGQIVARCFYMGETSKAFAQVVSQPSNLIRPGTINNSISILHGRQSISILRSYTMVGTNRLLAATDSGSLLQASNVERVPTWHLIAQDVQSKPFLMTSARSARYVFAVNTSDSMLCILHLTNSSLAQLCRLRSLKVANIFVACPDIQSKALTTVMLVTVSYHGSTSMDLFWIAEIQSNLQVSSSSVQLPPSFDATSVLYDPETYILLCGSRTGALAVYLNTSESECSAESALCYRRVHGEDTITSITALNDEAESGFERSHFYLTTGRDGQYRVFELIKTESKDKSADVYLRLVHQAIPPFGPYIEGCTVSKKAGTKPKLLLHGFRSKDFVVWDESTLTQVMAVECGGAHRSWGFCVDDEGDEVASFAWTKAGTFMHYKQRVPDHTIIRRGGHGREIKALAAHRLDGYLWLLATGSEDTDIRLFEYSTHPMNESVARNIAVLRKHNTGIQDLQFSPDGKILVSAAGMEEMFVWRLSPVPILRQGVVFTASLPCTDVQSDARIMSFDMRPVSDAANNTSLLIGAAFSNGKFKIILYDDDGVDGTLVVLHQVDLGAICLTQAHFLSSGGDRILHNALIAATNGHIVHNQLPSSDNIAMFGSFGESLISTPSRPWQHRIHQNNITSLSTLPLTPDDTLIVTGGDDNALALTLASLPPSDSNASEGNIASRITITSSPTYRTLVIPKAHAAALTALSIIDLHPSHLGREALPQRFRHIAIITASNDQRVQVWGVRIDITALDTVHKIHSTLNHGEVKNLMECIQVDLVEEIYTNVADISTMMVLWSDISACQAQVVIAGVGMESIDVTLPDPMTE